MDLIRSTYKNAGLGLEHTRYFEAHGTGTPVGDPIEASAIGGVFSKHRSKEKPMYVGALKTNVGHLEGSAGIAGLLKAILVLERGIIPPNINFEKPNPKIPVDEWGLKFPTEAYSWPGKGLRRASVNAFGYGGSNVHVILDDALHYMASLGLTGNHRTVEYPIQSALDGATDGSSSTDTNGYASTTGKKRIFVFSSFDEAGAERFATTYTEHLKQINLAHGEEETYLDDLSYTLFSKRSTFPWQFSVVTDSLPGLIGALESKPSPIRVAAEPKLGLVFTGQGAQWHGMGRELLSYPVFEQSLVAADVYLRGLGCSWSLKEELLKEKSGSAIDKPAYSQPICTALQVALVDLLKYFGVKYSATIGHSSGEIGAAYAIGAISCESAWKLSYFRGVLSAKLAETSDGAMMAVSLSQEDAVNYIEKTMSLSEKGTVVVACVNSPCNVTVSGKSSSIALLKAALDGEGIMNRQLRVENAYHSPYMEAIADTYRNSIKDIRAGDGITDVTFYSSLTGTILSPSELQDPDYWIQNLVSPVLFSQALTSMFSGTASKARKLRSKAIASPVTELIEIGPHGALRGPIREIRERATKKLDFAYESLLTRGIPADTAALSAIGWLHCHGHNVKLGNINENASASLLVNLPSYPFNHTQRYWNESRLSKGYRFRSTVRHELLGAPVPDWNPANAIWRNYIRVSENPWVKDHRITGSTIYPAAGMLVMAIEAARQVVNTTRKVKGFRIRDAKFSLALRIPLSATGIETHFCLRPCHGIPSTASHSWNEFSLSSFENDEWREHCRGYIVTEYETQACPVDAGLEEALFVKTCTDRFRSVAAASTQEVSFKQMYEHLSTIGLDFGPTFQTMRNIRYGHNHDAVATVVASDIAEKMPHGYVQPHLVHPTTLDGILQSIILALTKGGRDADQVMIPSEIRDLWVSAGPEAHFQSVKIAVQAKYLSIRQAEASVICLDSETLRPTASLDGFQVTQVAKSEGNAESVRRLCFNIDWKPDPTYLTQETANTLVRNLESSDEIARMRKLIEDVETICFLYIKRYLHTHPSPETIGSISPHHKRYVEWMKYQANRFDVGEIPHSRPVWLEQANDDRRIAAMEEHLESSSAEGNLCVAVGRALPDILAGKTDALALMFNNKLVENVYRYGTGAEIGYERMTTYIDTLAHKNPALKILEIGAGTGGATKPVLQCLTSHGNNEKGTPRFSRYDFTDISVGFFEKAKEMFVETADRMTFRALNAEGDLAQQGFDKEQYDVILAANVVHATKNLEATLSNVRKMIKPGGKLILYEMTNTQAIRTGFAFGLLPGWWLSDEGFRYWGPLASPQDWSAALKKSGFSGVDIHFFDFPDKKSQNVSVLVATALGADTNGTNSDDKLTIILEKESKFQSDLAGSLQAVLKERSGVMPSLISVDEIVNTDLSKSLCLFLPDVEGPFLENLDEKTHKALQQLTHSAKSLLWLNQGGGPTPRNAKADLVTGFARAIRAENPMIKFVTLSFDNIASPVSAAESTWNIVSTCFRKGISQSSENALYEKDDIYYIGRITEANGMDEIIAARSTIQKPVQEPLGIGRPLALSIGVPGLLDTLQFQDDLQYDEALSPEEVVVEIKATGLNLLDTLIALGQVQGKAFGQEGAGIIRKSGNASPFKPGDRVCGVVRGAFNTFARSSYHNWSKMPDNLSFTSAAAMPVVYGTAYHALHNVARVQEGETVLVHWGAGGVGQAAIQLASLAGANLIVTVGSLEKRDFIRDTYGIPETSILASRDLSFAQGVMRLTQGRGVDIVINSMSGQGLRSSWECIAHFGRFVEIGKVDIYNSNSLPMSPFKKNVTFAFIDIGMIANENGPVFNSVLGKVLQLAHAGKITEPKPLHVFSYSQIQEAFRIMQTGSHIGKFVLEPHKTDIVPVSFSRKERTGEFANDETDRSIFQTKLPLRSQCHISHHWWNGRSRSKHGQVDGFSRCKKPYSALQVWCRPPCSEGFASNHGCRRG